MPAMEANRRSSLPAPSRPREHARGAPVTREKGGSGFAVALMVLYATALAWAVGSGVVPISVVWVFGVVNLLTFATYWRDKRAAAAGRWRVAERTLHLWSLAGGWPAAWWSQRVLRHKSSKVSFRWGYWGTVLLHGAASAGWVLWRLGAP